MKYPDSLKEVFNNAIEELSPGVKRSLECFVKTNPQLFESDTHTNK